MKSGFTKSKSWYLKAKGIRPHRAWVELSPYDCGVYVLWPVNPEQLKAEYLNVFDMPDRGADFGITPYGGLFVDEEKGLCIAFGQKRPSPGLIAHEAIHLAKFVLGSRDVDDEEALCYLSGFITNRIYDLTRGKPCRV